MNQRLRLLLQIAVAVSCTFPALDLLRVLYARNPNFFEAYDYFTLQLAINVSGRWAFIFLFLALACSPAQKIPGLRWASALRRILGLAAFGHIVFHLFIYMSVGQKWQWHYILPDASFMHSRYPGWIALFLLVPLALTSTDGMARALGGKRWKMLHRLVYLAVVSSILHLAWMEEEHSRTDYDKTWLVSCAFAVLFAARLVPKALNWLKRRNARTAPPSSSPTPAMRNAPPAGRAHGEEGR